MKHPYRLAVLLVLVPAVAGTLLMIGNPSPGAGAATDPFRCTDSSLYFPASGLVGWTYQDPASTDRDSAGNRTLHTGVDVFAEGGDGAPVYAPADGVVSRQHSAESLNLVLPEVTNVLNGETGIELYVTHLIPALAPGEAFAAGEVIGYQLGDHVHLSVGAFIGYDDREIEQTQDPSPYFSAALGYDPDLQERQSADYWCHTGALADAAVSSDPESVAQEYVVVSGDTLSGIAEMFDVTVDAIAAANDMSDLDYLDIGQVLIIPGTGSGSVSAPPVSSVVETTDSSPQSYLVEDGDSLLAIAEKFGTDVESIVALNDLADPDVIAAGDTLLIP